MVSTGKQLVLAFDANCGPCSRFKAIVELLDAKRRIKFVPLEDAERSGLLASIAPASRYASFHLVEPASKLSDMASVWSGSQALLPLARLLHPWGPAASRIVLATPGGVSSLAFAYSALSRLHRGCSLAAEGTGSMP